jgi:RNA polymerase sigma-70 factor (ECF subfamily)
MDSELILIDIDGDTGIPLNTLCDDRDQHRIARIGEGNEAAFESLYLELHPRLFRFIYRMTRDQGLAEDLVNETLFLVWEKPEGFNGQSKLSTWIFGIAYRKTLKAIAKGVRTSAAVPLDDLNEILTDRRVSATREVELENLLTVAMASLSDEQRAVVELTFTEGLAYREIAVILGCPENTVKTRMFHARRKLEPYLALLKPDRDDYRHEEMT